MFALGCSRPKSIIDWGESAGTGIWKVAISIADYFGPLHPQVNIALLQDSWICFQDGEWNGYFTPHNTDLTGDLAVSRMCLVLFSYNFILISLNW